MYQDYSMKKDVVSLKAVQAYVEFPLLFLLFTRVVLKEEKKSVCGLGCIFCY